MRAKTQPQRRLGFWLFAPTGTQLAAPAKIPLLTAALLTPDVEDFRDSRGKAWVIAGNRDGAITDFQAFVNSTKDEFRKSQRQAWINALRRGENPFTPEQLKRMFRE